MYALRCATGRQFCGMRQSSPAHQCRSHKVASFKLLFHTSSDTARHRLWLSVCSSGPSRRAEHVARFMHGTLAAMSLVLASVYLSTLGCIHMAAVMLNPETSLIRSAALPSHAVWLLECVGHDYIHT